MDLIKRQFVGVNLFNYSGHNPRSESARAFAQPIFGPSCTEATGGKFRSVELSARGTVHRKDEAENSGDNSQRHVTTYLIYA